MGGCGSARLVYGPSVRRGWTRCLPCRLSSARLRPPPSIPPTPTSFPATYGLVCNRALNTWVRRHKLVPVPPNLYFSPPPGGFLSASRGGLPLFPFFSENKGGGRQGWAEGRWGAGEGEKLTSGKIVWPSRSQ